MLNISPYLLQPPKSQILPYQECVMVGTFLWFLNDNCHILVTNMKISIIYLKIIFVMTDSITINQAFFKPKSCSAILIKFKIVLKCFYNQKWHQARKIIHFSIFYHVKQNLNIVSFQILFFLSFFHQLFFRLNKKSKNITASKNSI